MLKNNPKTQKGFTIIEVLIVLAIAGLILLIVFLAVPALQRNSRNTGRDNDVARVGTAVNNWVTNNSGVVFTAGGGNANLTSVIGEIGNTSQYTLAAGTSLTVATGAQNAMTTLANIVIVTGAQCDTSGKTVAGAPRAMAIQYALESAGGSATAGTGVCKNI